MCNKMTPVFLACSALMAQPGHGSSGSGSSLQITVNSVQQYASKGLPTLILPDSAGPYTNGSDGVCATMGTNATVLTLELDCSSEKNPRYLVFQSGNYYPGMALAAPTGDSSYGCPSSSPLTNPPSPASPYTNKILVGVGTAFQSMQAGIVYNAQITIATQSTTTTGTSAYRLDYDTGADFPSDGANSSPAWVYAVGFTNGSATKWVIESAPASQLGPPNTAMLVQEITAKHFDQATECGFYQVPFSFTLAAQ